MSDTTNIDKREPSRQAHRFLYNVAEAIIPGAGVVPVDPGRLAGLVGAAVAQDTIVIVLIEELRARGAREDDIQAVLEDAIRQHMENWIEVLRERGESEELIENLVNTQETGFEGYRNALPAGTTHYLREAMDQQEAYAQEQASLAEVKSLFGEEVQTVD